MPCDKSLCEEYPLTFISHGYKLSAFIHLPNESRFPLIVFFHGFTGSKIEANRLFVDLARALCYNGIAAFRFDFRGHGDSPLPFEDFRLSYAIEDAEASIHYVKEHIKPKSIGILGLSMGGNIAVHIASKFSEIKVVVLLSPALTFNFPLPSEKRDYFIMGPHKLKVEGYLSMRNASVMNLAEKLTQAVLIIHPKNDPVVPYTQSVEFYDRLKNSAKKKILLLENGGHVLDTYESKLKSFEEIVSWIKENIN